MARIRTIKPEFFTSEDITSMSPLARLFYVSLWCESDREGRLEWKPGTFKLRYLPGDDCDVAALGKELIDKGLIVLYTVGGKQYAEIPTFTEHQVINNRESESTLPARDKDAPRTRAPRVKAEGKGKERKEGKSYDRGFEDFWKAWPQNDRKQDKRKCADKWMAEGLTAILPTILADVAAKKKTKKWIEGFVEAPEVYLNNRRWEDGNAAPGTAWHESKSGIVKRGVELGLGEWDEEGWKTQGFRPQDSFEAYKGRVMAAHQQGAH
jgi:hypothetical protein